MVPLFFLSLFWVVCVYGCPHTFLLDTLGLELYDKLQYHPGQLLQQLPSKQLFLLCHCFSVRNFFWHKQLKATIRFLMRVFIWTQSILSFSLHWTLSFATILFQVYFNTLKFFVIVMNDWFSCSTMAACQIALVAPTFRNIKE